MASSFLETVGRMRLSKLITPAVVLAIIFIVLRWANSPSELADDLEKQDEHVFQVLDDKQIETYIKALRDTRPDSCLYDDLDTFENKISIILDFHEHQFYDVKMTLESIIKHTPDELIHEIVLLDDGTGTERVRLDAHNYLQHPRFYKVKGYRSDQAHGPALTRFKASKVATGDILIFLSSEVAVNKGWLQPLVDIIRSDRHVVAVPHFDSLLSGYRFFQTPENLINIFSWTLETLFMETEEEGKFLKTPVMTGAAFAVDKQFLDDLGSFDEGIMNGGGDSLELSMRVWMCGGSIKIVSCSRVAVRNALEPHKIKNTKNFRRIVDLWLDNYKTLAYKQAVTSSDMEEPELMSLRTRKMYLKKQVTCDGFKDYLKQTANGLVVPPDDARHFGKLKSKTGYCLKYEAEADNMDHIKLVHCRPHMYEPDMLLTFDTRGHIKTGTACLDMLSETDVQFVRCDKKRNEQSWIITSDGLIKNAVNNQMCINHATGEGSNTKHFLAISQCIQDERTFLWQFLKY